MKKKLPHWLKIVPPTGNTLWNTHRTIEGLSTVCQEARCPNLLECFSNKTAAFLALGSECTRSCGFCNISFSEHPLPPPKEEPEMIMKAVVKLGLQHVVVTMVTRDDLKDGGSEHMAQITERLRSVSGVSVELLISDLSGDTAAYDQIIASQPDILNHNLETIRRLTPRVRHKATYDRSLACLRYFKEHSSFLIKSGMMLGLGETFEEVCEALRDLRDAGCDIVAVGQYLQPNPHKLKVKEFIEPETFQKIAEYGLSIGIPHMYAGPFVRPSFNAGDVFQECIKKKQELASTAR